ncbi:hypothetical protein CDAR_495381 [Caerostris darwini]|uniref:Uncharacterized protein n=1 Tax=Caerostris darwini TaxID=1538125 RepID=A0AAV4UXR9_9ARAC|nr:hypothetical protein CDAR_495381 [Caerostris darwini]
MRKICIQSNIACALQIQKMASINFLLLFRELLGSLFLRNFQSELRKYLNCNQGTSFGNSPLMEVNMI